MLRDPVVLRSRMKVTLVMLAGTGCGSAAPVERTPRERAAQAGGAAPLSCHGQTAEDIEPVPDLGGSLGVRLRCERDRLVVFHWGPDWQESYSVPAKDAERMWDAFARARTHAERRAVIARPAEPDELPFWKFDR